jgi:hypothetical protein
LRVISKHLDTAILDEPRPTKVRRLRTITPRRGIGDAHLHIHLRNSAPKEDNWRENDQLIPLSSVLIFHHLD